MLIRVVKRPLASRPYVDEGCFFIQSMLSIAILNGYALRMVDQRATSRNTPLTNINMHNKQQDNKQLTVGLP